MKSKILSLLLFVIVFAIPIMAQSNPVQNKLLARRAAISDAYRILSEIIYGIYIDSDTMVRDFITTNDTIRGNLDGFIRAAEIISESYKDEIYKVTMRIDVERLRKLIGKKFKYETPFIEVVGKGAPRGDSGPAVSSGRPWYADEIEAKGYGAMSGDPQLSRAQKILMAERAAKLDAYRNLIERIKGVQVDSNTTVQDFITQDDTIMTNIQAFVRGARTVSSKKLPDGSYEVVLRISLNPLKAIIR
jgi:hypothetical protein